MPGTLEVPGTWRATNMEMAIFFILALIAVLAAVGVIVQRSVVRSALFLLVNFTSLAGLYLLLNAQFVAVVQVIVYAGAVVVLFLFVVMLLGIERAEDAAEAAAEGSGAGLVVRRLQRAQWVAGALLGVLLLAGIAWAVVSARPGAGPPLVRTDNVRQLGEALMTGLAVPFELVAVVLLVAIIGTVVLAKKKLEG